MSTGVKLVVIFLSSIVSHFDKHGWNSKDAVYTTTLCCVAAAGRRTRPWAPPSEITPTRTQHPEFIALGNSILVSKTRASWVLAKQRREREEGGGGGQCPGKKMAQQLGKMKRLVYYSIHCWEAPFLLCLTTEPVTKNIVCENKIRFTASTSMQYRIYLNVLSMYFFDFKGQSTNVLQGSFI